MDILDRPFELNMSNYGSEDVDRIQAWALDAFDCIKSLRALLESNKQASAGYRQMVEQAQERIRQIEADINRLRKDAARLDAFDLASEAYGFEDAHDGNRWCIDGPFQNIRDAIDETCGHNIAGEKG